MAAQLAAEPSFYKPWIDQDLEPWRESGITAVGVELGDRSGAHFGGGGECRRGWPTQSVLPALHMDMPHVLQRPRRQDCTLFARQGDLAVTPPPQANDDTGTDAPWAVLQDNVEAATGLYDICDGDMFRFQVRGLQEAESALQWGWTAIGQGLNCSMAASVGTRHPCNEGVEGRRRIEESLHGGSRAHDLPGITRCVLVHVTATVPL